MVGYKAHNLGSAGSNPASAITAESSSGSSGRLSSDGCK